MERDLTGVRLTESGEHLHITVTSHRCNLTHQTALTGDHLTRVKSHPQPQLYAVAVLDFDGEPLGLLLHVQGRQTGTHSVVLKGHWCPEDRHDAVAGELVHRAPGPLHHRRRTV